MSTLRAECVDQLDYPPFVTLILHLPKQYRMLLNFLYSLCLLQLASAAYVQIYYKNGLVKSVSQKRDQTLEEIEACQEIPDGEDVKQIWFSILANEWETKDTKEGIKNLELFDSENCEEYYLTTTLSNVVPYDHKIIERTGSVWGNKYKSYRYSMKNWEGSHFTASHLNTLNIEGLSNMSETLSYRYIQRKLEEDCRR